MNRRKNIRDMNYRDIEVVYWPVTESEQGLSLQAHAVDELFLAMSYHGDHDEMWIVAVEDGKETFHNPRYVETIVFDRLSQPKSEDENES